ncbi:hypothetical protein DPM33_14340 [Mesorhizobium hawassense]|uniref:Uncharacterized protein n=1 Tax=Mesorhizobium hawassense TaxID=1209954 RepID=A0A330HR25_9HYPH|nr:hypothetical protein DPM33_14340 [Mesorhizobium hawassense]
MDARCPYVQTCQVLGFAQLQTEGDSEAAAPKRCAFFLELRHCLPQFRTENRFALFLELL